MENEEKKQKALEERLGIASTSLTEQCMGAPPVNKILLDGKDYVALPETGLDNSINLLGVTQEEAISSPFIKSLHRLMYVGCGSCCNGPLVVYSVTDYDKQNPVFRPKTLVTPGFNIYDFIPIKRVGGDWTHTLVTGYGCSGAGIKLVDTDDPSVKEVMSNEEFSKHKPYKSFTPGFQIDEAQKRIYLVFEYPLEKDGCITVKSVNPVDITDKLVELGVDIEGTIKATAGFTKIGPKYDILKRQNMK